MKIDVKRFEYSELYTISKLYVNSKFVCYVLEDKVREVDGQDVTQWKIPNTTAIPKGTYEVTITFSNHFGKNMPLINKVSGYSGVRIHSGNKAEDTEGCLLVGSGWAGGDSISYSHTAFNALFPLIETATKVGEVVTLQIGDSLEVFS